MDYDFIALIQNFMNVAMHLNYNKNNLKLNPCH